MSMAPQLIDAIISGTSGITLTVTASDLKEIVAGMVYDEQQRLASIQRKDEPCITRTMAAKILGVSTRTIDNMVNRGELPITRIGGIPRFSQADLEKYKNDNRTTKQQ